MYETIYDKLQLNVQKWHYMDTDSFVLSINSSNKVKDLQNLDDLFDFSNLNNNHELFSNRNKKKFGKLKIETTENLWIDEFVFLINCVHINVEVMVKLGLKVYLKINQKVTNLKNTKIV